MWFKLWDTKSGIRLAIYGFLLESGFAGCPLWSLLPSPLPRLDRPLELHRDPRRSSEPKRNTYPGQQSIDVTRFLKKKEIHTN